MALAYVVLVGGTTLGELGTILRIVNALASGALILIYVLRAPSDADAIDRGLLLALLLFLAACIASAFPRQSFDAALSALTYVSAFYVARRQLADVRIRDLLVYAFIGLSSVLTLVAAYRWLIPMVEWWAAVEWRVAPPLNLELAAHPWGHRHDLTLAIVMLYPAWCIGDPSVPRRAVAVIFGVLTAAIVMVDGSRTLWIALVLASCLVLLPLAARGVRMWLTPARLAAGVAIGAVLVIVTGIGAAFAERAFSLTSLGWRTAMWGPLVDSWLSRPLTGSGPGSFPWILQQSSYFDTNSWAPRHPDSAVIQVLAEGGVLGIGAMAVLVLVIGSAFLRSRSIAPRWVLLAFALASIGGSPTDFAFLVAIAIAWAAYELYEPASVAAPMSSAGSVRRAFAVAGLGVVVSAYGLTAVASVRYDDARAAIADGRPGDAHAALDAAVGLDPGMALYRRQRGALHYLAGEPDLAIDDLRAVTTLNPSDDLAWRTLALAHDAVGDDSASRAAISRAIDLKRSDETNLLLSVALAPAGESDALVLAIMAEVVQTWPTIVFSPGWQDLLPPSTDTATVAALAAERWATRAEMPALLHDQALWLTVIADRPDLYTVAVEQSPFDPMLARAMVLAFACDEMSMAVLDEMPASAAQDPTYWRLRYRASLLEGTPDEEAARVAGLMHVPLSAAPVAPALNPLRENGLFSADVWGYRRRPIAWPDADIALPSSASGMTRWFYDPTEAVIDANLERQLPSCAGTAIP
jgi:O-antigen ligase